MTIVAVEAMEVLGGNGYVEESPLARLYREAPLNGIWEGSANVICLDVLRAIERSRDALAAIGDEIATAPDPRTTHAFERAAGLLAEPASAQAGARVIVESLAMAVQASLMKRHSEPQAAEAFCASRLDAARGHALGTLGPGVDAAFLVERAALEI
jgi:putative acyl-CoA dehydrogenase